MAINAVITQPRVINANTSQLVSSQANPPIALKNNVSSLNQNYLHNLLDVDQVTSAHPADGDTLVYNANTGKYDVAPISIQNASLDGGSF